MKPVFSLLVLALFLVPLPLSATPAESPMFAGEATAVPPTAGWTIATFLGTGAPGVGPDGLPPLETALYFPQDLTFGPDGRPYVADWNNHRVLVIDGGTVHRYIGNGELGDAPAGVATEIGLNHPTQVAFDPTGHLILSAWHNSKVMRMDPVTGLIAPFCGTGIRSFSGDGGPAIDAELNLPSATAVDPQGRILIADQANQRIRRVGIDGIVTTVAGTGIPGFSGDGGPAIEAEFRFPVGQAAFPAGKIATDAAGNLYIADTGNHRIRMVDTNGIIHTVAGNGIAGFSGEGVPAIDASLRFPTDVAVDGDGDLYIADAFNHCIRKVDTSGIITTFAGVPGTPGFGGDGGDPRSALLNRPSGVGLDGNGNVYIADTVNNRIRVVSRAALAANLVLKPGACPAPLNVKSRGVLPAAVLGTGDLDVHTIDPSTIRLEGAAPLRSGFGDVGGPSGGDPCDCGPEGGDGIEDLTLKFDTRSVVEALGPVADRDEVELTLAGSLLDGTPFTATACAVILDGGPPPSPPGRVEGLAILPVSLPSDRVQKLRFEAAKAVPVRIRVFDVAGRLVAEIERDGPAGTGEVEWDAGGVPGGIYFARIEAGGKTATAKVYVVR